ncbi:MAG: hypothetical protein Q8M15_04325 [Bacteroidota bacterium]|nr:hypothetical protein [Bacteroidota bacterium]
MKRFIITAVLTGLLFGLMDGLINANPFAVKLMECYKPIAKQSINVLMGLGIDLLYGFIISSIFILIKPALPSEIGIIKGLSYGLGIWFFRVMMGAISSWMMYNIPIQTLIYVVLTGLIEMTVLGILNGLMLKK